MTKRIYTALALLVLGAGCAKDPSLVGPTNAYSTSNYPSTLDGLNSVLAPCYSNLRDPGLFGFHFLPKAISNSEHAVNSIYNGDASWNDMAAVNVSPTNEYVNEAWQVLFTGVKNCNVLLEGADLFTQHYAKSSDLPTVALIKGQAYFLRAYYYFELECLYGEDNVPSPSATDTLGVPIFNGVPTTLAQSQQPRSSIKNVWALIESDLQQAATLLKGQVWTGNDEGRVTDVAAEALLGKAYVFTKNYAAAKTMLSTVIGSGKGLVGYDTLRGEFIGITAYKFNRESLFELNIDQNSYGGYGVYSGAANSTTIMGLIWPPWALGSDGTEGNCTPMGYGNEIAHWKNVLRYGYKLGTYNLVANPNYNAAKGPSYNNPQEVMDPVYKAAALAARTNGTVDPRLYISMLQPWVDSVSPDGQHWYPVSRPNFEQGAGTYGWSIRKYTPVFNNINNVGPADDVNLHLLRMADVYLLYAEACANTGDPSDALEYINKVKRRAYGYPINSASPIDYASLTAATMAPDPSLANNPLYYERWAELFNEGQWWLDVCRWHLGPNEAAYYGSAYNVTTPLSWSDKSYVWPIPLNETNSNPLVANQQNPGY
ncbi:RagB/SusD family nutrient uptake outer membrane protein [Dinghuibacter silviterrae]|uniref:Putative outer membrane starch-binding protein n=1 Tax=Dinghuibacter silviterrae TaxID=1539049 RepID=A0A4R8DSH4_9BACT|nr:RagB/SusD family nutrient uptake outer membrane protein [Dinghuibacter silviterrae]TDX00816.1 putative outer membrane starch-binding protein [Dinghuibacter silviterrae]